MASKNTDQPTDQEQPVAFQIRLKGRLDARWSGWFEGMQITHETGDVTLLTGVLADQAALHGLLKKVRDLGIPLISVVPAGLPLPKNGRPAARKSNET